MPYNADLHERDDVDPTNQGDVYDAGYRDGLAGLLAARTNARLEVIEWLESRNRAFSGTGPEYAQDARARFGLPLPDDE